MSTTATRIPLAGAVDAAAWLLRRWAVEGNADFAVVGSVRRCRADIGDLDFIAPLPPPGGKDDFFDAMSWGLEGIEPPEEPNPLFAEPRRPAPPKPYGRAVMGCKPHFKMATFELFTRTCGEVKVNVSRYVPGPQGNRGWTELRTTGPEEFGKAILTRWKAACGTAGTETQGSVDGFLVDAGGKRFPTPNELSVFQLARCLWVDPRRRCQETVLCVDWLRDGAPADQRLRASQAMNQLGLIDKARALEAWDEQRLALSSGK